ncbi:hypothetical protein [Pseudomonas sp. HY7a-MNA-CIBAN-0227]|uniref:hypothetical protein n=1 Tax=Pseudomonas sp. HY7a-MNA-CIBAN-0227 TaxID=3140474 RepID=UPI003330142D
MKIKNVEIVGFRAYADEGDGNFNFSTKNVEAANFVSIYAPNGFGKSSLYDAIEWAITNNIGRYIRDGLRSNNDSTSLYLNTAESGQSILRNRYISEDAPSYVKINVTGNGKFERDVRKAALGRRDYAFKPENTDESTKHLTDIFLSQDAIDAFLKEEKPEVRYEKFVKHFGGNDEKYRAKLNALRKTCNAQIKKLTTYSIDLKAVIEEPIEEKAIELVNNTIDSLNELGENFDRILPIYDSTLELNYKNKITKRTLEISEEIDKHKRILEVVNACLTGLPDYYRAKNSTNSASQRLQALQQNNILLNEQIRLQSTLPELRTKLSQIGELLSKHDSAASQLDQYIVETTALEKHRHNESALLADRNVQEANSNRLKAQQQEIQSAKLAIENRLAEITRLELAINPIHEQIIFTQRDINDHTVQLDLSIKRLNGSIAARDAFETEINRINSIPEDRNILYSSDLATLGAPQTFPSELSQALSNIESYQTQITSHEKSLACIAADTETLEKLISLASELIGIEHSDKCPVCSHKHESYEALSQKILNNSKFSYQQQSIIKAKNEVERKLQENESYLTQAFKYINELKAKKVSALRSELGRVQDECLNHTNQQQLLKLTIESLTAQLQELRAKLSFLDKEEFLERCREESAQLTQKDVELNFQHKANELKANEILVALQKVREDIEWVSATIAHLSKSPSIQTVGTYLQQHAVARNEEHAFFSDRSQELKSQAVELSEKIVNENQNLEKITKTIGDSTGIFEQNQLSTMLDAMTVELNKSEETIIPLTSNLRLLDLNPEISESLLKASLVELEQSSLNTIEAQRKLASFVEVFSGQLENILPAINKSNARNELASILDQLNSYSVLNIKLGEEFVNVESRLKKRIDSFFYTELINRIYLKIDPHPSFKIVKFECIFPDDKPRLEVYLEEEDGKRVAPNLYFSAAQLNILSLSIFLARALHVQHEEKPVETILIDDPIHSMDSINVLSTIDLLRNIAVRFDRQIILSTHDENFFELLKIKLPSETYESKFIKLESFGKVEKT